MTVYLHSHLGNNKSLVVDSTDGKQFPIPTDAWPAISALPNEQQRAALEQLVSGRTTADEQAMDTARDASSGEAHQDAEANR